VPCVKMPSMMVLNEHNHLPGLTEEAQKKLDVGKVVVLGATASGLAASKSLIQLGLGNLLVVDEEAECLSAAAEELHDLTEEFPEANVLIRKEKLQANTLERLVQNSSVVIDALSDWQDKLLASDVCMSVGRPLIHSGVIGFRMQIYSMLPKKSACLRCALPLAGIDDVPHKPTSPIGVSAVAQMVGSWQSIEALKIIAQIGATQGNEFFKFDSLSGEFEIIRGLDPPRDCPDCGSVRRHK